VYHLNWGLKGRIVPREWTSAALYAVGWYAPTPNEEVEIIEATIEAANTCGCDVYACMMSGDHIHILIGAPDRAIIETIRLIKGRSSYMFNRSRATRTIRRKLQWQRHYHCKRVRTWTYFLNARDYITSNRQHHKLPPLPQAPGNSHLIIAHPTNTDINRGL